MTDSERLLLEAIDRLTNVVIDLTRAVEKLDHPLIITNQAYWTCWDCHHVNGANLDACAVCGAKPQRGTIG